MCGRVARRFLCADWRRPVDDIRKVRRDWCVTNTHYMLPQKSATYVYCAQRFRNWHSPNSYKPSITV